jgi:large subunit ribosomal protein L32e
MSDITKALEQRKIMRAKRPKFIRDGARKKIRITDEWRRPRGRHSKVRHNLTGHAPKVKPGFRTQRIVRGMTNAGLIPVIVNSLSDISKLDKKTHCAIIAANTGSKNKIVIYEALRKQGVVVYNITDKHIQAIQERFKQRKSEAEKRVAEKEAKKKKEVKKEEKKETLTEEEKAEKEKEEKNKVLTKAK